MDNVVSYVPITTTASRLFQDQDAWGEEDEEEGGWRCTRWSGAYVSTWPRGSVSGEGPLQHDQTEAQGESRE